MSRAATGPLLHVVPSPNHDARAGVSAPDIVVLHYTQMTSAAAAVQRLCDPASRVSAHYLVAADGSLVQMVEESRRAWHAGVSGWDGTRDVNSRSIGIELDSPGHTPDAPRFPEVQIAALLRLLDGIRARWPVPARHVVAHSDVAPMRKIDPGERFPWAVLAAAGHALALPSAAADGPNAPLGEGAALAHALRDCGYDIDGVADVAAVVRAFHRRHRPRRVAEPADAGTLTAARAVAALVAADRAAHPPLATSAGGGGDRGGTGADRRP